jgi:hypothetical protein
MRLGKPAAGLALALVLTAAASQPTMASDARTTATAGATATATAPAVQVSVGSNDACAITTSRAISCWGSDEGTVDDVPTGRFTAVSNDSGLACAIRFKSEMVACWDGSGDSAALDPLRVRYTAVTVGPADVCGITYAKAMNCWDGAGAVPPNNGPYKAIALGPEYSCAITIRGTLFCWGENLYNDLKVPSGTFTAVAVASDENAFSYACAIPTTGRTVCWTIKPYVSELPRIGARLSSISMSGVDGCGLAKRRVVCWALKGQQALRAPQGRFVSLSVGGVGACGVTPSNLVRCWSARGQISAPPAVPSPAPAAAATVGEAYSSAFQSSAGTPTGTFAVTSGQLPPGLALSASGTISGTPTTAGTFTFTVTASNLAGGEHAEFTIEVAAS